MKKKKIKSGWKPLENPEYLYVESILNMPGGKLLTDLELETIIKESFPDPKTAETFLNLVKTTNGILYLDRPTDPPDPYGGRRIIHRCLEWR